jgi:PAS domain S-box-containing protein
MVNPVHASTDHLESLLEFESLLFDLSSRFINLPPGELDREIEGSLHRVCEFLDLDLAVLWQWSAANPDTISATHAYSGLEGLQRPEEFRQDQFPWCREQMLAGRVVSLSSLEDLPAEALVDRDSCFTIGIRSSLTLPLVMEGSPPIGALALNTLRVERDWPDGLVKRLQLIARILIHALVRRRADLALRESEERLSLAVDSADAGLWSLDFRTRRFWASEKARAIFGYPPDEVISLEKLEASVHPEDWELVRGAIERSASEGEFLELEYRILLPADGRERWVASRGRPQFKPTGEPLALMGLSMDITGQMRTQEKLHKSEARLTAAADLAGLGFYEVDFDQGVAYVDQRFRDVCGVVLAGEPDLQALEFWIEHLHPDDRARVMHMREQLHAGKLDRLSIEYRFLHPAEGQRWIRHLAQVTQRDAAGRAVVTFGVLRNITEQKRAEKDLRDLSQRLIRAHEEERALLARELHDDVTQRLAVLAIDAGLAERAAPDGVQAMAMRAIREGLVRLSEDIHSLAYQLHPSVLAELGLSEALRTECERVGHRSRVHLRVDLDPLPAVVGKDRALCLFRVAQEALNNMNRHSGASAASISLRQEDGGILLTVRDNGIGFDPGSSGVSRSLGLASMRERVRLVDGSLDIESAPDQGTVIVAWIPVGGESS